MVCARKADAKRLAPAPCPRPQVPFGHFAANCLSMATKTRSRRGRKPQRVPSARRSDRGRSSSAGAGTSLAQAWEASGAVTTSICSPVNRYRGANPILATLGNAPAGSACPFWCGFAEAKKLGIFPKKGSAVSASCAEPGCNSREEEAKGG